MSREVRLTWKLLSQKIPNVKGISISKMIIRNGDPFSKVIRDIFRTSITNCVGIRAIIPISLISLVSGNKKPNEL